MSQWWDFFSSDLFSIVLAVVPGTYAWWSGRQLLRFLDDPALNERALARAAQVAQAATVAVLVLYFVGNRISNWLIPAVFWGVALGGFRARRRLLEEQWTFAQYLVWTIRWWVAWVGFWLLLALAPTLVSGVGGSARIVASVLAAILFLWYWQYSAFFLAILGARPLDLRAHFQAVLARSTIGAVRLVRIPVPGGRFANALALPSRRVPSVAFSDTLLEALTEEEQAAVFGHELAHLEHIAAHPRRWLEPVIISSGILLGTFFPFFPRVSNWMFAAWFIAVLFFFGNLTTRMRKVEVASDRRAVALSGSAESVERALIKLTLLAKLPRRWSVDMERGSTHPSLARRIRAIREAGGEPAPPPDSGLTVLLARSGTVVLLAPDHLDLLEGVGAAESSSPEDLRARAKRSRRILYADLVDLRVQAGLIGGASLLARDRLGKLLRVRLQAASVPLAQAALDLIDIRLGEMPVASNVHGWLTRALGLVLLLLAWLGTLTETPVNLSLLASGLAAVFAPAYPALVAVTITAAGFVLFSLLSGGLAGVVTPMVLAMLLVVAMGAFLAVRVRNVFPSRAARLTTILFLLMPAVAFWVPLLLYATREAGGVLPLLRAMAPYADTWILPAALGGAVYVGAGPRLKRAALLPLALAVAIFVLGRFAALK